MANQQSGRYACASVGNSVGIGTGAYIQWLSRGGEDKLKNLVLVCPSHHAAIHQVDAPFDFADLAFDFRKGNTHCREPLLLNSHLPTAA
jgi:hypothetical protein